MAIRKYNSAKTQKKSIMCRHLVNSLSIVLILLPVLGFAQSQTTPILQDPMNNAVFSFNSFNPGLVSFDHKNYFHSLSNNINDPTDPTDSYLGMWFRMMFPNGYDINDSSKKYPLILFMHGRGERGTTNTKQLLHGGQIHRDAVLDGEFPGLLLYPQINTSSGIWSSIGTPAGVVDQAFEIVMKLIKYYNVDPNRIYVHGLSGGATGTWYSLLYYPQLIAAALPMSSTSTYFFEAEFRRKVYSHIPIWESQGGKDTAPLPTTGNYGVETLRDYGVSIRYDFQPGTGHGTWNTMYNKPDFFTWMLQYSKTTIHVFYEQSQYCPGEQIPANLKLGVTAGFDGYEWALNGTSASDIFATGVNEIIATTYGDYFVRIKRGNQWSEWSDPRTIDDSRQPSSPSPVISSGLASVALPALDGSTSVKLFQTSGPTTNYQWYSDNIVVAGATNDNYTVTQHGNYTLTTKSPAASGVEYYDYWNSSTNSPGSDGILDEYPTEFRAEPLGCASTPSNVIGVTTGNGPNSPLPPINFFVFSRGPNESELVYDDNSDNETGFEIYRSEDNGINFDLISIQPASDGSGSISYSDIGLQSSTQYCYRIRAVNGDGGSPYTEMACTSTTIDTTPPTPPFLVINSAAPTFISLSWSGDDDVGVVEYDIYRDGILLNTLSQNNYVDIDVIPQNSYTYYIIAKDAAGNQSTSNQEIAATVSLGLDYKYYHLSTTIGSVDQIENEELIKEGIVDNFDISIRDRSYRFGFVFEGNIEISTEGTYQFYSTSDDGSRVIINGITAFNNDGPHGCSENGNLPTPIFLTAGFHRIKVLFFENGGGECLTVNWSGPGISKSPIPSSVLAEGSIDLPNGPNEPANFLANAISYNQIDLSWTDNSNNETGFEIYRYEIGVDPWYKVISVVSAGVESYSDQDLLPATTYYYRILAKNDVNVSDFVYTNAQTQAAPSTPSLPSTLNATAISTSQISLSWTDNSTNELGFEVYRATYDIESSYLLIATTAPNIETFLDSGLPGGTTFYYKIRAKGAVNNSAFTPPVNRATLNNPPVITTTIPDRSIQIGTVLEFEVQASDLDQNVVTFNTDVDWPAFGTVTNIGQNRAIIKFEYPTSNDYGTYTLRLRATDGIDVVYSNFFAITVNNNVDPVVTTISDQQMEEGKTLTVNISASDDSGILNLSTNNLPSFATFNYSGIGGTASIYFNPYIGQAGYYENIQIVANDGQGGITEESFNLVVDAIETSYQVFISFDNSPRFDLPWNYIGGADLRILANDIWPIGNLYTSNQSTSSITIDAVEMDQVPNGKSFYNDYSFSYGGPGIQGNYIVPDNVIKYGLAGDYQENNKLIINGLEEVLSYELSFMSSVRTDYAGSPWTTTFRINGISKTINPVGNATELLRFVDIRPTNGMIEIEMLTSGGSRTMLNAFTLEAYYDDSSLPSAPSDLVLEALSSDSILVRWKDNSTNETAFDIYRRSEGEGFFSLVGSVNKNIDTLLDQSGINGTTRYYYYVQARNNNGHANSGTLDVISLNASPIIAQLNSFAVKTGQKTNIPVSATDYENDPITLSFDNLPTFASFVDHGNGTGTITLDPDESLVSQSFELELNARDSKGGASSNPVIFEVINGNYLQTIYLNLTQSSTLEVSKWNDLTANPATTTSYGGIKDINGNNTTVGLALSGTWTGQTAEGLTYLEEAVFPANVMKAFWFTSGTGIITLTGLDPTFKYNLSLFSSTDAPGIQTTTGITDYPENSLSMTTYSYGTVTLGVDAFKNPNKQKKISGLSPDSGGNISFTIQGSGGIRAVLNAIILEKYQNETKPFAPTNVIADVISTPYTESSTNPAPFHVELNWADNSGIETGYEITRYDYSTGTSTVVTTTFANVQTYKDTDLTRDKKFGYRIRAISLAGVSEFASIADVTIPIYRVLLNINYYSTDDVTLSGWNNTGITPDPGLDLNFENLKNDDDISTSIALNTLFFGTYAGTVFTGVNSDGLYPSNATKSYWQLEPGDVDVFEWAGLDDALKYNLVFFGSRIAGGVPKNGRGFYTVGTHTVMYNTWDNLNRSVQIKGISPDQGRIEFEATSDGGIPNYCYFNVLELQPYTNFDLVYPTQDFYYYAADNSDINTLANWLDNPDESGGNPSSFSEQGLKYVISDEKVTNLANNLTIGGAGSKMILKDDVVINFTASNLTLNMPSLEIDEGASVTFGGSGLSTATITIGDGGLTIRNGAILDIGDAEVTVSGLGSINPANTNGVISSGGGSISLVNTSSQTNNLYFTDGSILSSLKIDNSNLSTLAIHDTVRISDKLEVTNGHLITNGYIKLISDANGTAMIPEVGWTSTITGAVEYQRYWARSKGGYYYIGVPVHGQTLTDWQSDFYMQGIEGRYPAYWTNVYTFDESTNTWIAMDNITNPVEPGRGITTLMFSSEFADGFIRYSNTGDPVYGTFRVDLSYTDRAGVSIDDKGWQLVANPYACAIDLSQIDWANDVDGVGSGVYIFNGQTNMYETWSLGMGSRAVASGQGFFIKTDGSSATPFIDFKESHKVTSDPAFLRTGSIPNLLTVKMVNQDSLTDKFYVSLNDESTYGFESLYDAYKYKNSAHNIYAIDSAGNDLAVHSIPALSTMDSIRLVVESASSKTYKFVFEGLDQLEKKVNIYLVDHYLNSSKLLNEGDVYSFNVDKNTSTSFGQRFTLVAGQPGVVGLSDRVTTVGKNFKMPLTIGQVESLDDMNVEVLFNSTEFKLRKVKLLNQLPGLMVDTTNADKGKITIYRNSGNENITISEPQELFQLEFLTLESEPGKYNIWIEPESWIKTIESKKYAFTYENAVIDLRRPRRIKGNIVDVRGRPYHGAIVNLYSEHGETYAYQTNGTYGFDAIDQYQYDLWVNNKEGDYSNVDLRDLIQLTRFTNELQSMSSSSIEYASDVNDDGLVNIADVGYLRSQVLSKNKQLPTTTIFNLNEMSKSGRSEFAVDHSTGKVTFVADDDYNLDFLAFRKGEIYHQLSTHERDDVNEIKVSYDLIPDNNRSDIMHLLLYLDQEVALAGLELHLGVNSTGYEIVEVQNLGKGALKFDEFYDNSDKQAGFIWVDSRNLSQIISDNAALVKLSMRVKPNTQFLIEDILSIQNNSMVVGPEMELIEISEMVPRDISRNGDKILTLYPNPAQDQLNIVVNASEREEYKCVFFNAKGQILFEEKRHLFKGINTINIDLMANQHKMNTGYYFVRVESSLWVDVKPFVIK